METGMRYLPNFIFILMIVLVVPASAELNSGGGIIGDGNINIGETYIVNSYLTEEWKLSGFQIGFTYDPTYLEIIGVTSGNAFGTSQTDWQVSQTSNSVTAYERKLLGSDSNILATQNLVEIQFKALKEGNTEIYLSDWRINDLSINGLTAPLLYAHIQIGSSTINPDPTKNTGGIVDDITGAAADAGASMFMKGMELFMFRVGDMIFGVGSDDNTIQANKRSSTDKMILNLMTYNVDPFSIPQVQDWQDYAMAAFVILGILALFIAFIASKIDNQAIDELIGDGFTHNRIVDTTLLLFLVPIISVFGVWVVLKLNYVISAMIGDYMIMTIPQTSNNFVIYIFAGIAFLLLSVVMLIRTIFIVVFVAISLIVGVAYSVTELRPRAVEYIKAWLHMVFLQPYLLLILLIGIIVIEAMPPVLQSFKNPGYVILVFYLAWVGYRAITGNAITTVAKIIIFKKVIR
jgi:hypothetical protein